MNRGRRFLYVPRGAAPARPRQVVSAGLRIAVHEWGDEAAPPLLLAHGGFDFAGTYDVFAPLLPAAGWRVVSWDHRGHGDSDHAALYNWEADMRDARGGPRLDHGGPLPSSATPRAASLMLQLADACPTGSATS